MSITEDKIVSRALVGNYFADDQTKVNLWFETKNPSLGMVSPNEMIRLGRTTNLRNFIEAAIDANAPPTA